MAANPFKRICSKNADLERNTERMLSKFRNRGYKENTLTAAKTKIAQRTRSECLISRPKKVIIQLSLAQNTQRALRNWKEL